MSKVKEFLKDVNVLLAIKAQPKYKALILDEHPFDHQLLSVSSLYRQSRKYYFALGGKFEKKICSTMRSLSAQDLFKDEIDYTPALSEFLWFKDHHQEVSDPEAEIDSLMRFNDISLYHEQNHRVLWRLLPPAPKDKDDLRRYLNFAESLVVTLDIALGDEVGNKLSPYFEGMNLIYRPGGNSKYRSKGKAEYRKYLLAILTTTYYALELVHNDDILNAVNYVLPNQKKINKDAVNRGLELNEHFTRITNPQWQELYWKSAALKLKKMHKGSQEEILHLPEDPLDIEPEFFYARRIFDYYGL